MQQASLADVDAILPTRSMYQLCSYTLCRELSKKFTRTFVLIQFYICSKCKDETQLDSSSVIELQRVYRTVRPSAENKDSRKDDKKFMYNRSVPKVSREVTNPTYYPPEVSTYKQ